MTTDHRTLHFDSLPDESYLRESQLATNPHRPDVPTVFPFSNRTLRRKVQHGDFPAPVKLGPKITAWKVGDVRAWIAKQVSATNAAQPAIEAQ